MKILNADQTRKLDTYTIEKEPITSLNLMERASQAFCRKFLEIIQEKNLTVHVFCGQGNNGGDGLAIARILFGFGYKIKIYLIEYESKCSNDYLANLERLLENLSPKKVNYELGLHDLQSNDIVIDAILGSGLTRPTEGLIAHTIQLINNCKSKIIAVDIPSGLYIDQPNSNEDCIIQANYTISFQLPKLAFLLPQNQDFVGDWHLVDIGLNQDFIEACESQYFYTNQVVELLKPRHKFANKGSFGHALLIAGSFGMMGAAILSARSCLRSGVGKLTVYVPQCGYEIMQISVPEAMVLVDDNENWHEKNIDYEQFDAIGIGPGLGKNLLTARFLKEFLQNQTIPLVIDADALNIIAENEWQSLIPQNSVLTPHPKEFERLIRKSWKNDFEKLKYLTEFSRKYQVTVALKGAHTAIAKPDGEIHFNATGNAGMAKAGTGDALTGMITSLLAQGYSPDDAVKVGVFEHGLAGDRAVVKKGKTAMIASDLIDEIAMIPISFNL